MDGEPAHPRGRRPRLHGPQRRTGAPGSGGAAMTWLTWRQLRVQSTVVLAALAVLAVALLATAHGLRSSYTANITGFIDELQFQRFNRFLYLAGLVAVHSVGPVIGAFCGAPLVARELEAGTHRLVWNQSATRHRW